jgi:hypothetical protein
VGKVATFMVCGRFLLDLDKDRFLGVDPLGQQVPPRVRYRTTCLLIREVWVCVLRKRVPRWGNLSRMQD